MATNHIACTGHHLAKLQDNQIKSDLSFLINNVGGPAGKTRPISIFALEYIYGTSFLFIII